MMLSRYEQAVKKYVHSRLAPRTDHADDVVQDVFLAAWENLSAYRGSSSLQSWLMGIARNKVRDYYRAHLRQPDSLETTKENSEAKIASSQIDDHLDKERARIKIRRVLNELPEKYRVILIWRYWNEFPVKAIAARMGKTEKATERQLAHAREEFRSVWHQQLRDSRLVSSERAVQPLLFGDFASTDGSISPAPRHYSPPVIYRVKKFPIEFFPEKNFRGGFSLLPRLNKSATAKPSATWSKSTAKESKLSRQVQTTLEVLKIMIGGKSVAKLLCMFSAVAAFTLLGFMPGARLAAQSTGAVYVLTNQPSQNAVMLFHRNPDGSLLPGASFPTGGAGLGSGPNPLGSQGSLILSGDNRLLFAVNAGSDSISVFSVSRDSLTLVQTIASGGTQPVSLTNYHDMVYVLNTGGASPNVSGFQIVPESQTGKILVAIPGSTQLLPNPGTAAAAEVSFTPDGSALLVTEPGANEIVSFSIGRGGQASLGTTFSPTPGAGTSPSTGVGPFGLSFSKSTAITANTANQTPQAGSMSSYAVVASGELAPASSAVPNNQTASTWAIVAENGKLALTTNTVSGTISSYDVSFKTGSITLAQQVAASLVAPDGTSLSPSDMALSSNGQFLYVRNGANGSVTGFAIQPSGALTPIAQATGLPDTAAGIAAR